MPESTDSDWLVERNTSHAGLKVARVKTPAGWCMIAPIEGNMTDDELRGIAALWQACYLAAQERGRGRTPTGL